MSRRSPLAVLALLSLVASLLALPALPAAGKNGEADDLPLYKACVPSVIPSAGFADVSPRSVAREAIDCMVHFGIMKGTSSTTFEPDEGVTREQMALILIRAAGPAGIDVPAVRDQGFRDIGELSRESRDSINQLAQLGITKGRTTTTYVPHRVVNRRQMAQFFTRFLKLAPVGEGGVDIDTVTPDDKVFTDIEQLPHDPYTAIRLIYELGVTKGTTATTYSPAGPVTRAQMALFVSRMLSHTNARPAGITMQVEAASVTAADTVDLVVSVRDKDHMPRADVSVDLFYVAASDEGFASSGRCSTKAILESGSSRCTIDLGDETTDGDGNLFYTMEIPKSLTVYAWTGDRNDRFDIDDTVHASLEIRASKKAAGFLLTDDMVDGDLAKQGSSLSGMRLPFGATVTFTFQVVDEDLNPVAVEDAEIRIRTEEWNDNRRGPDRTRTYDTDSSGQVQITYRLTDPDTDRDNPHGELNLEVLRHDYTTLTDKSTVKINTTANRLRWSDDDSEPRFLLLEQSSVYSTATASGSAHNRVTGTLLDQYGDPVRGKRIHFVSGDQYGLYSKLQEDGQTQNLDEAQNAYRKTTNRRGVATVSYTRNSNTSGTEAITAFVKDCTSCTANANHYWVDSLPASKAEDEYAVHHYDAGADTLVIEDTDRGSEPGLYAITFDPFDHFLNDASGTPVPVGYRAFKEALAMAAGTIGNLMVTISGSDPEDVNRFVL